MDHCMANWKNDIDSALVAFRTVAELACHPLKPDEIRREDCEAPHCQPTRLPPGMMAVYCFWGDGVWLKVGKAGPKSNARYTSQHYGKNRALSSLARSLCGDERMASMEGFNPADPAKWIKAATHRVNLLLSTQRPVSLLGLLEAFLHARLNPRYEG